MHPHDLEDVLDLPRQYSVGWLESLHGYKEMKLLQLGAHCPLPYLTWQPIHRSCFANALGSYCSQPQAVWPRLSSGFLCFERITCPAEAMLWHLI
ncbi:hypothetical protein D3C85_1176370 [compost metagenome]